MPTGRLSVQGTTSFCPAVVTSTMTLALSLVNATAFVALADAAVTFRLERIDSDKSANDGANVFFFAVTGGFLFAVGLERLLFADLAFFAFFFLTMKSSQDSPPQAVS